MSIDTLLEAARYLEWQAQQQQITREEEQRREKAELHSRDPEPWRVEVLASSAQPIRFNHATWGEEPHHQQHQHLPSVPPPPLPPPPPPSSSLPPSQVPIAIIPMVPVVAAMPSVPLHPLVAPVAATTMAMAPLGGSLPLKNGSSPPPQQRPVPPHLAPYTAQMMKAEPNSLTPQTGGSPTQSQPAQVQISYPASIITAATNPACSQHALLPQPAPPTSQPRTNGMVLDDMRGADGKRRPGGAGTREVHNKLEKNRRAHLKECFETLKKNVPNVDEKKTSNLSVLRSALRYIQTLKRKEKEYEHEMERLAREKIATQQRLAELKNELSQCVDVMEIDRVLRQTVQPEEDQASTSTASEGEEVFDQDMDEDISSPLPILLCKALPPILQTQSALPPHLSIQHTALPLSGVLTTPSPSSAPPPQAIAPAPHPLQPPTIQVQPTVIAHATHVSHPSVIQAVNHVLPANHKHLTHIAPSPGPTSSSTPQPIGHITVHPVAHLPGLYPQGVSVSQPTVVGHITHTFTHHTLPPHHVQAGPHAGANSGPVNGAPGLGSPSLGKPTAVLAPLHHPSQLVGQTAVLNPVTMVTVPPFPVSTLKLA